MELGNDHIIIDMKLANIELEKRRKYDSALKKTRLKYNFEADLPPDKWPKDEKYLASICGRNFTYVGQLNDHLQRNKIGKNNFSNGDRYFGNWLNNKKLRYGIYVHLPVNNQVEIYHGNWEKDEKNVKGIYIWKKLYDQKPSLDKCSFDAYLGKVIEGEFDQGLYISQKYENENLNRYIYFGRFSNGVKKDDKAFYYLCNHKKLFNGSIEGDELLKGYISEIKDRKLDTPYYFDRSKPFEDYQNQSDEEELKKVYEEMKIFLNMITENDFFRLVYVDSERCLDAVNRYEFLEELDNKETLDKDIALLAEFTKIVDLLRCLYSYA
jgi:hypothetical protein